MRMLYRGAILIFAGLLFGSSGFAADDKPENKTVAEKATAAAISTPIADNEIPAEPSSDPAPKPAETGEAEIHWTPMPAMDGNPGLFTLETGEIIPKGGFDIAFSVNKISKMPGSITVLQLVPALGVGINRWLSVFVDFQAHDHIHVDTPSQLSLNSPLTNPQFPSNPPQVNTIYRSLLPGTGLPPAYVEDFPFASTNGGGYGEIDLGFKIGLLSERRGNWASLSIRNDFYIPTRTGLGALESNEVQYGNFSYGIGAEASKTVLHHSILATINWSYRFMRQQTFTGTVNGVTQPLVLNLADQMGVGAGLLIFPDKRFNIITEYSAIIYTRNGLPNTSFGARDPVDNVTGIRFYLAKYVALDAGYRYSMNLSNHLDRNGFYFKLAGAHWPEKPRVPDTLTASCSVDKSSVMEGSSDTIQATATATDSYGHPLNYNWTATGGNMDGKGPYARWSPGGAGPGSYTLTSQVDDSAGKSASCSSSVTVQHKPAPATPRMSCSADRSNVLAGERPQITADVNDPSGTALSYKWQSNGGQLVGSGSSIQLDTSGLSPGNYTVTGRVENAAGGAADCSVPINVSAPPPPPQASKVGECPYGPGSATANNVCKRVLDDVAVRLQTDPKAKTVLVGYADPKEHAADRLANQRAAIAKKYLGEKKGIDPGRIETRSAAGTAGAGKENRRLDAVIVPEGATY
jgi:outer membrane protein OmpA-like peptidoglycan-associated protein